jgi:hypothetical protein
VQGVDPAVAVGLTEFHALYSTVLPILLAELMFRHVARERWLGRRGIIICAVLCCAADRGHRPRAGGGPADQARGAIRGGHPDRRGPSTSSSAASAGLGWH